MPSKSVWLLYNTSIKSDMSHPDKHNSTADYIVFCPSVCITLPNCVLEMVPTFIECWIYYGFPLHTMNTDVKVSHGMFPNGAIELWMSGYPCVWHLGTCVTNVPWCMSCVTHVPWCMSGSLTQGGGENDPGISRTCSVRNITYLARSWWYLRWMKYDDVIDWPNIYFIYMLFHYSD